MVKVVEDSGDGEGKKRGCHVNSGKDFRVLHTNDLQPGIFQP
jgi:hypothetical protein